MLLTFPWDHQGMIEKLGVEVLNVFLFDGWKNIVRPLVFNGVNPYFFSPLSNQEMIKLVVWGPVVWIPMGSPQMKWIGILWGFPNTNPKPPEKITHRATNDRSDRNGFMPTQRCVTGLPVYSNDKEMGGLQLISPIFGVISLLSDC